MLIAFDLAEKMPRERFWPGSTARTPPQIAVFKTGGTFYKGFR
jgi:hypothetical protein